MTGQQEAQAKLDNKLWREKRRLLETMKFTWETLGPEVEVEDLLRAMYYKAESMDHDGLFEAEKFQCSEDGRTRQLTAALLEIAKRN